VEKREKAARPLNRIMSIEEEGDAWVIATTDSHLARSIGEAIHHAHQGKLALHYGPDENLARVTWTR
jgi:hypothetical protein